MKPSIFIMLFCFCYQLITGQNIGIGTLSPNASAILDITATDKGMLVPRVTSAQRTAITSPAAGLLLYDTTTSSFWYFNGGTWMQLSTLSNTWSLTGNSGTNPSTQFIGTTDSQPLKFRVNNLNAGSINPDGNLFLGLYSGN